MLERNAETKIVKAALAAAGFKARVTHGTGTAWGWLHVTIADATPCTENHDTYRGGISRGDCPTCHANFLRREEALPIVKAATGRRGEYDGQIQIRADH